tara:strand:+ start:195 stop:1502 length:1308 start_codon:yes stop_codon:yes gene_type:complete
MIGILFKNPIRYEAPMGRRTLAENKPPFKAESKPRSDFKPIGKNITGECNYQFFTDPVVVAKHPPFQETCCNEFADGLTRYLGTIKPDDFQTRHDVCNYAWEGSTVELVPGNYHVQLMGGEFIVRDQEGILASFLRDSIRMSGRFVELQNGFSAEKFVDNYGAPKYSFRAMDNCSYQEIHDREGDKLMINLPDSKCNRSNAKPEEFSSGNTDGFSDCPDNDKFEPIFQLHFNVANASWLTSDLNEATLRAPVFITAFGNASVRLRSALESNVVNYTGLHHECFGPYPPSSPLLPISHSPSPKFPPSSPHHSPQPPSLPSPLLPISYSPSPTFPPSLPSRFTRPQPPSLPEEHPNEKTLNKTDSNETPNEKTLNKTDPVALTAILAPSLFCALLFLLICLRYQKRANRSLRKPEIQLGGLLKGRLIIERQTSHLRK